MVWSCDCGFLKKSWVDTSKAAPECPKCHSVLMDSGRPEQRTIYGSLDFIGDVSDSEFEKVKQLLLKNRGVFFRSKQIGQSCGIIDKGSCPKVRKVITGLIFQGYPIISTLKGYSIPNDKKQVHAYIESLEGRRNAINDRIKALKKAIGGA